MSCSEFEKLLESWMDGDDSCLAALREHASECPECAVKLEASMKLRDLLADLDDDITVPLPAQAAWRGAIREEAAAMRRKRLYRRIGVAAAAVCVTVLGLTAFLRAGRVSGDIAASPVRVETDAASEESMSAAQEEEYAAMETEAEEYVDVVLSVEDVKASQAYLDDIMAEYGGTRRHLAEDSGGLRVYIGIPAEAVTDFEEALDGIGTVAPHDAIQAVSGETGICVILRQEEAA